MNVTNGKEVGETLGKLTLAAKDGAVIGGVVIKSVFTKMKDYVKDVAVSYKETVVTRRAELMQFQKDMAQRIIRGETFQVKVPGSDRIIDVIDGEIQNRDTNAQV